ncbi:hypothetical protein HGRIS_009008 [Hohenbuehelia grisea]|uniref:AB hydrolase-1 domain-containing protein n=1 Tax=Hohenbuehelia grisea TaxID=104357 RepID=A0ABR3IZT9_9AGAR
MLQESITYPPSDGYPFYILAKRYWLPAFEANASDPEALTLILLHSTSFHKEAWEPSLEDLFQLASRQKTVKIREAWTLDCPNHGDAAQLNDEVFKNDVEHRQNFTCEKYARAAYRFLSAGPQQGAKVDFTSRNLVGIGHSLGGVAMTVLQGIEPRLPFSSIVLVEPMLSPEGRDVLTELRLYLLKGAYERRDVWPDRKAAKEALLGRSRTVKWDRRVVDLYVKHAIRPHPGSYRTPDEAYNGVTLSCTREEEAGMYLDVEAPTKPIPDLDRACERIPVHLILGGKTELPKSAQKATMAGRRFASIKHMPEAGHLIPQEAPKDLAHVILDAFKVNAGSRSKL